MGLKDAYEAYLITPIVNQSSAALLEMEFTLHKYKVYDILVNL